MKKTIYMYAYIPNAIVWPRHFQRSEGGRARDQENKGKGTYQVGQLPISSLK